jgi:alpha-tubulin suppressor-like RCC1 family protein
MPNQFLSDEFGDIEDYFVTDYWLIDNFVGDQLWTWGNGGNGSTGSLSSSFNTFVIVSSGATNWKQVSVGGDTSAAIKTDGTLWVWGRNSYGQLGTNDLTNKNTPVTTFAGGTDWKSVFADDKHMAAVKTDGSLWVWGRGLNGDLGNNAYANRSTPVTTFAGGNNWKQVSITQNDMLATKTDGTLWVWGQNFLSGTLGINSSATNINTPVTTFAGGNTWKQVLGSMAIKTDGTLWVWGGNGAGRLGTNDTITKSTPVTTFAGGNNWRFIGGLGRAIKTDGSLWVWGEGADGRLGTNDTTTRSTPVPVFAGGNNWKSVAGGYNVTAAIKTDGTLWVWGRDDGNRRLGTGNNFSISTPVTTMVGGNNWKQVSITFGTKFAIKSGLNVDLSFFPVGFVSDELALYLDAGNTASYPGSGTTWTDLSGNGRNGTLSPTSIGYNNDNGGSLVFDGVNDYVSLPANSINTNADLTLNFWNKTSSTSSGSRTLLGVPSGSGYLQVRYQNNTIQLVKSSVVDMGTFTGFTASTSTVYLITITLSKSTNTYSLYVNGSFVSTFVSNQTFTTSAPGLGINNGNEYFNSNMYAFLYYNRALTATEIQQNFNFFKPRFGL